MSFHDWLYSVYPPDSIIDGKYKMLHILTMVLIVSLIIVLTFIFRRLGEKHRLILISVISAAILIFELTRRVVNFTRGNEITFQNVMRDLLPRPWCAISCWFMIFAPVVRKTYFYNFTACNGILCTLVFFAYPAVGFNHSVILFENLYSIATHSLLLLGSVLYIVLRFAKFEYYSGSIRKSALRELVLLILVFAYAFVEIYLLKIERDPLYFLKDNDVQKFLGCSYSIYLLIYSGFLIIYFNAFYIAEALVKRKTSKKNQDCKF